MRNSEDSPILLCATEAAEAIARGRLTSERLVSACLERIAKREETVGAWEYLDSSQALEAAARCDSTPPIGPLHGVPVGIKDIIDTADQPTCYGSRIYRGYRPTVDAECVKRLKAAGAIILGKTVTTEFAVFQPGKTTNPHNRLHTPGGSSSGSAAAVADHQVMAALGTQTAGSVIRPASFCGVVGYKPSYARFPFDGVMLSSTTLDTLGTFTRTIDDAALVGSVLSGVVFKRPDSRAIAAPRIGLIRTPWWKEADPDMRSALETGAESLAKAGAVMKDITIPSFDHIGDAHARIMYREIAASRQYEYEHHRDELSPRLREIIERGRALALSQLQAAIGIARRARYEMASVFATCDVVLTPAAVGSAPVGLAVTGDPLFNRAWTLLGAPCLTYPGNISANGLPLGLQVVGAVDDDDRLLAIGKWMQEHSGLQSISEKLPSALFDN
jgi:Asp-tRNA(Asn)/Glu-tRNA(Gln) amidotransferase A subunit family amidase